MRAAVLVLLVACAFAAKVGVQDQIAALLQTGTGASDAIDSVFGLLKDLKQSNADAQTAADSKNKTDELIGGTTISKFTEVQKLNQKILKEALANRQRFEQDLKDTKNYLAWNEARQDEITRKSEVLFDNQCYSNQLFVRSIRINQEALEVVRLLKQDVAGYVINGSSFEFAEIPKSEVQSIAEKLKQYSHIFNDKEVQTFLALAQEDSQEIGQRKGTLAERVHSVLDDLEHNLQESLENLKQNEIAAAWQLAAWLASSNAEQQYLVEEHERKQVYADRCATQIQAALAQQAKSNIILKESTDAVNQAISDLENKRAEYASAKSKRDEENAILDEVITMFKKQVSSWSGRF